jgi:DNA repair protein RadC
MQPNSIGSHSLKIRDFPSEEKPRERLEKYGAQALSNSELLAIILGKGTRDKNVVDLSKEILSKYNLNELSQINVASLSKIKGIGFAKACQIVACFELGRRNACFNSDEKPAISCAKDVFNILNPRLRGVKQENFIGLFLDTKKKLIKEEVIFMGSLDSTVIHPREILKIAVLESAAAIITAHNHPSGDPTPSNEDLFVTRQIANACREMAIPLLDHIVIGYDNFVSIREIKEMKDIF